MSKFVVYQPVISSTLGNCIELSDIDAAELVAKCESQGHIVACAPEPVDAILLFGKKMQETVNIQGLFTGNLA